MGGILQNTWVVVPVGARHKYLEQLVNILSEYKGRIVFVNNKFPYPVFDGVHHIEDFEEINIHRWWNKGIDFAKNNGAKHVAVLNDDLVFDSSLIFDMVVAMKKGHYEVSSAMGNLGVFWIIDTESEIKADENLRWWCGDGDIFRQAKIKNKLLNYETNRLYHLEHNVQTSESDELRKLGQEDLKKYRKKLEDLGQLEHW
jgi:glycosyltransferase involved in cell wall biosynthesis